MRGIPSKVEVVVGSPLPLYRLEILKDLVKKWLCENSQP
jgi:hypothetical protein